MPVLLENGSKQLDSFDYETIEADHVLNENKIKFLNNSKESQDSVRCLYVGQRESATVRFDDSYIDIVGSDDATTCHIALIVDDSSGNCSLCHFDDHEMKKGIQKMMNALINLRNTSCGEDASVTYSLYIVGGFDDDRKMSIQLTRQLLKLFINLPYTFHLKLCVVSKLNDVVKDDIHYPIIYGLGYDIKAKKLFKCNRFLDKGPDLSARSAKHYSTNFIMDIYDTKNSRLIIGPFEITKIGYIENILKLPDSIILNNFSTSPEQEPPEFVENTRKTFEFMKANPKLLGSYFIDGKPRVYEKKDDGSWQPV